ncbi:MAG: ECF-type sigma factor [bacterium]
MQPPRPDTVAQTLHALAAESADRAALEERLYSRVYSEMRSMARGLLRGERADTLQPTELVHEAYVRLVSGERIPWEGRAHFFGAAARAMRQVLVDRARRRKARKRGGDRTRVTLHPDLAAAAPPSVDLLALDACLEKMRALDERMARVVELRIFAGMTVREVACVLSVSERTVDGDWAVAKKWLRRELAGAEK